MWYQREKRRRSLAPRDDLNTKNVEDYRVYAEIWRELIKDHAIRNIVLTGNFGVGKSSIIETFEDENSSRYLHVSLIDFSNKQTKAKPKVQAGETEDDTDTLGDDTDTLEFELLRQITSRCTYREIPFSTVELVPENHTLHRWALCIIAFVSVLSGYTLFYSERLGKALATLDNIVDTLLSFIRGSVMLWGFGAIIVASLVAAVALHYSKSPADSKSLILRFVQLILAPLLFAKLLIMIYGIDVIDKLKTLRTWFSQCSGIMQGIIMVVATVFCIWGYYQGKRWYLSKRKAYKIYCVMISVIVIVMLMMGMSVFSVFFRSTWEELLAFQLVEYEQEIIAVAYLLLGACIATLVAWGVYSLYSHIKLREFEVTSDKYGLKVGEKGIGWLDKYGFELVYTLENISKKYHNTIVFEDMDRLEETRCIEICSKLRQINQILWERGHTINFVYTLNDERISKINDAMKFFDYILPVYTSFSYSNGYQKWKMAILRQMDINVLAKESLIGSLLKEAEQLEVYELVDYRTTIDIYNEYELLTKLDKERNYALKNKKGKDACKIEKQNEMRLLFVIYKVVFAEDYFKLRSGQSVFSPTYTPPTDGISSSNNKEKLLEKLKTEEKYKETLQRAIARYSGYSHSWIYEQAKENWERKRFWCIWKAYWSREPDLYPKQNMKYIYIEYLVYACLYADSEEREKYRDKLKVVAGASSEVTGIEMQMVANTSLDSGDKEKLKQILVDCFWDVLPVEKKKQYSNTDILDAIGDDDNDLWSIVEELLPVSKNEFREIYGYVNGLR